MNDNNVSKIISILIQILLVVVIVLVVLDGVMRNTIESTRVVHSTPLSNTSTYYDVSALERNGAHIDELGTVRMVTAWYHGLSDDGKYVVVKDTSGELWTIDSTSISKHRVLLLWIVDNNTTITTDDVVVQVWQDIPM